MHAQVEHSFFPVRRAEETACVYLASAPTGKVCVDVTGHGLDVRRIEHRSLACRSDGVVYDSTAVAAHASGLFVSQVPTALKSGRSTIKGFNFTRIISNP